MNIYTLTLNPAYDVHGTTQNLKPYRENFAAVTSREAGGKGINISRALNETGLANTAIVVLGSRNGAEFKALLAESNINALFITQDGYIRENLTLHEDDGKETRISFAGFCVADSLPEQILPLIEGSEDTILTFTGSIPTGLTMERVKAFLKKLQAQGIRIVIDCRSFTVEDILELQPWLIKPNQEEVSGYFGCSVDTLPAAAEKAKYFHARGMANAVVSMGSQGMVMACSSGIYTAAVPQLDVISTIGAGDSAIAGFLAAAARDEDPAECLRSAAAFGSAACLTQGTLPPRKADILRIKEQIVITKLT